MQRIPKFLITAALTLAAFLSLSATAYAGPFLPAVGGTGTSTPPTYGQVLVGNANGTYTLTATSSLGITTPATAPGGASSTIQYNANGSFAGSNNFTFDGTTATINALHLTNQLTVPYGGTGSTTLSGILKGNGTGSLLSAIGDTDYQKPISLTTTGSSGAATFSGDTLNIPQYSGGTSYTATYPIMIAGSVISTVATSSLNLTTSSFASSNVSQWTNDSGYLTAALTSIGPAGQTTTGPAVTISTTTSTTNGITSALTVTGSGSTLQFTPSQSGTLTVSGGGTGAGSFSGGQVLFGNGTGVFGSEATGTIAQGTGITVTGTGYDLGSGITITNSGVTSLTAGSGISVSGSAGGVTVTDTNGYPFTPLTDFGLTASATTSPIWAKGALFASSTISAPNQIDNYNSTNGTTTNATSTNAFATNGVDTNFSVTGGSTLFTNGTSNTLYYGANGTGAPGTAAGEKLQLFGSTLGTPATSDYSVGVQSGGLWFNTAGVTDFYKNDVLNMQLGANGLSIGTSTFAVSAATGALDLSGLTNATSTKTTEPELNIFRNQASGISFPEAASFAIGRYQTAGGTAPSTELDIDLKSTSATDHIANVTVESLNSNGNVGVGSSTPWGVLSVNNNTGQSGQPLLVLASSTASATTTVLTVTPQGALTDSGASNTATSTFTDGLNVATAGGCLAVNGTCVSTSAGTVTSVATNNGITGGTITTSGTIGLATIGANTVLANNTGSTAVPTATATSSLFTPTSGISITSANISQVEHPSFTYATSSAWTGTTTIPLQVGYGETWNSAQCFTDAGTLSVDFYHATNHLNFILSASTTIGTNAFNTNNTITAGDKVYVDIGTPASSPTHVTCTVKDTI
jgi:hypothetical protein